METLATTIASYQADAVAAGVAMAVLAIAVGAIKVVRGKL